MLQYERIDISEGINFDKSDKSKEGLICHYWYFKDIGYKYEAYVCNKCHDLLMFVYDLKNFTILNIKGVDYRCYVFILETFIPVSMVNGIESHGKNLMVILFHLKLDRFY